MHLCFICSCKCGVSKSLNATVRHDRSPRQANEEPIRSGRKAAVGGRRGGGTARQQVHLISAAQQHKGLGVVNAHAGAESSASPIRSPLLMRTR